MEIVLVVGAVLAALLVLYFVCMAIFAKVAFSRMNKWVDEPFSDDLERRRSRRIL